MNHKETLLLTRRDVAELLSIEECLVAIEQVFKLQGEGKTQPPGVLGILAKDGGFHIKAGVLELDRPYFAAKTNANFPQNTARYGLPLIQGLIILCDGENGRPLAVMDSIEITIQRTGAATAVAAKHLARSNSEILTICGCGSQGRISLRALCKLFPIRRVMVYDSDQLHAKRFAQEFAAELGIAVEAVREPGEAVRRSDICVTCTPSKKPFLKTDFVRPGTFLAAVGADSAEKQELEPSLMRGGKVVVDMLEQCAEFGELHHALTANLLTKADVHAELGEVIAGTKPGRTSEDETIIFDSTGMALQDVIAAVSVYERAIQLGTGSKITFAT
jgi:alanine dehydrogenase